MVIYLDEGHGGVNRATGRYVTAPNKMFRHEAGIYHDGPLFYEGVFNRQLGLLVGARLEASGHEVVRLAHPVLDTRLAERVDKANRHWLQAGRPLAMGISIHANAFRTHNATGWEVYTSPGQTSSDEYAELLWNQVARMDQKMRADTSDGDHDKEAKFYMLTRTKMPFVLAENFYFDNPSDARKLVNPGFLLELADCYVDSVNEYAQRKA